MRPCIRWHCKATVGAIPLCIGPDENHNKAPVSSHEGGWGSWVHETMDSRFNPPGPALLILGHVHRLQGRYICSVWYPPRAPDLSGGCEPQEKHPAGINSASHGCLTRELLVPLHSNSAHHRASPWALSSRIRPAELLLETPVRNLWSSSSFPELSCHNRRRGTGGHQGAGRGTRWSGGEACWCGTVHEMLLLLPITWAAALPSVMPVDSTGGEPGETSKTCESEHLWPGIAAFPPAGGDTTQAGRSRSKRRRKRATQEPTVNTCRRPTTKRHRACKQDYINSACRAPYPPRGILMWWRQPGCVSLSSLRGAEDAEWTNERRREAEGVGVPASAHAGVTSRPPSSKLE